MRLAIVLLLILVVPAIVFGSNLYIWRDSAGKLHITDYTPPSSAKDISYVANAKRQQSPAQISADIARQRYEDQVSQREYQRFINDRAVSEYNKQIEDINDRRYEQKKNELEMLIKKWDDSYDIRDSKDWRDHCRLKRDYYKERLKILKRHH